MTTTTLTAYQLNELLRKAAPHVGRHSGYAAIQGVHLDSDGRHLHAVATDRFTVAVARERLRSNDPTWALTVRITELPALASWTDTLNGESNVHLSPGADSITCTSGTSTLVIAASTLDFPDWRGLVRTALEYESSGAPYSGFLSEQLARWEKVARDIHTWQPAPEKPLVVIGHGFLGLQMPTRVKGDFGIAEAHADWADSLGGGDKVEQDQTLHHWEAAELDEKDRFVDDAAADLLQQVLRSTSDMFRLATGDSGALAAYALAGGRAWMAYRLLKAMQTAAPDLLRHTLADVDEQLESGEIGEWAWDAAEKAGHDPQAWHDEYEAHLKKRAEEKPAQSATAA
ncbi:hypothetical protein [Streptomyces sp. MZ04]|uniref:hypothetical protein n=1 Tax=Streptomyces sp. MZ04 TaxID=2559236 RepID=UPI00107E8E1A|nr:hypothetical protein [Streptomyces sp. MZ04]TGB11586.1 hypothetical protein E2651_12975 [Streptomyces sp. MZ04]